LPENEFSEKYNFPKPKENENVVFISRTSERRALAAAEIATRFYKR
jgi:hypothetical protein